MNRNGSPSKYMSILAETSPTSFGKPLTLIFFGNLVINTESVNGHLVKCMSKK